MDELRFDAGTIAASYTTPDGWERVYLRLARPNWDYKYFNRDGTTRVEVIGPDDLFSKASTDTAKMMPLGIGHPATQRVDSFNVDHYLKGATGHTVLREKTADGEFLGITATIFSEEAKQASRRSPGVSPGYSVKLVRSDASRDYYRRYNQTDRVYNHGAIGVIPRGGAEVRAVFEGLRVDSTDRDDCPIWVATYNSDCYAAPVDIELVRPLLERSDEIPGLAEKSKIDLNRQSILKPQDDDDEDDDDEDADDIKVKTKAKGDRKDAACGPNCECENCSPSDKKRKRPKATGFGPQFKRKDSMSTTEFKLDGVTYQDIPIAFAQAVAPVVKRADNLSAELTTSQKQADQLGKDLAASQKRADQLQSELTESKERADGLDADLKTSKARVDELEKKDSSDGEDRTDEEDAIALALDIASTVDQMRSDGLMLQELGLIENFNTDFAFIADNMGALQKEMLSVAYPNQRTDGYNERDTAIAYDTAMGSIRAMAAQQRADAEAQGEGDDRQDMYYPDMGIGRMSTGRGKARLNSGALPTLHKIGQMSRPMRPTASTVRSLLNKFEKMEEAFFDEASKQSSPMLQHPMAAKIM